MVATLLLGRLAIAPDAPVVTGPPRVGAMLRSYAPLLGHRPTLGLIGASALSAMGGWTMLTYLGAFFVQQHGFTTQQVGWAYMLTTLGVVPGTMAVGGRLGRLPLRPLLVGSQLALGLLIVAALTLPAPGVVAVGLMTLAGFVAGVGLVATSTLLTEETPAGRATTMVLNRSAISLGTALGSAAGGLLLAVSGYGALGLSALVWCGASAGLTWWSRAPSPPGRRGARAGRRGVAAPHVAAEQGDHAGVAGPAARSVNNGNICWASCPRRLPGQRPVCVNPLMARCVGLPTEYQPSRGGRPTIRVARPVARWRRTAIGRAIVAVAGLGRTMRRRPVAGRSGRRRALAGRAVSRWARTARRRRRPGGQPQVIRLHRLRQTSIDILAGLAIDRLAQPRHQPELVGQIEQRDDLAERERVLRIVHRPPRVDAAGPNDRLRQIGDQRPVVHLAARHRHHAPSSGPPAKARPPVAGKCTTAGTSARQPPTPRPGARQSLASGGGGRRLKSRLWALRPRNPPPRVAARDGSGCRSADRVGLAGTRAGGFGGAAAPTGATSVAGPAPRKKMTRTPLDRRSSYGRQRSRVRLVEAQGEPGLNVSNEALYSA